MRAGRPQKDSSSALKKFSIFCESFPRNSDSHPGRLPWKKNKKLEPEPLKNALDGTHEPHASRSVPAARTHLEKHLMEKSLMERTVHKPITHQDDSKLIEKAKRGDSKAIEKLIEKFQPDVRKFAVRVCRTNEDAEDAVQHTLFAVFSKIGSFRSASKFTTWLFSIVKNECFRLIRKIRGQAAELSEELADSRPLAFDQLEKNQVEEKISSAISRLEPTYREVILLRDVEGWSTPETARELGISVEAVKSRLHRARNHIRDEIAPILKPK